MKEQTKKRNVLVAVVLAIILVGIVGTGLLIKYDYLKSPVNNEETSEQKMSLRLKWLIYSSFAHHLVAAEKGLYAKQGLQVEIKPGGPGIDAIKSVALGEDDIGLASYAQILLARQQGVPVVAIAEEYIESGVVFMSLKDSGITKPQDFIGKKVGLIPGSDTGTVYDALMAKEGIDRSKITEIPVGSDMAPLFNNTVDIWTVAFISNQPIVAESKGFPVNIIDPKDYGIRVGGNVVFTTEKNLKEKRSELKRFVRAMIDAIELSKQMPNEEVVDIVLKYNPKLDRSNELKIWQATKDYLLSKSSDQTGVMPEETWKQTAEVFNTFGSLKQIPDLQTSYTNDLVNEVLAERKSK